MRKKKEQLAELLRATVERFVERAISSGLRKVLGDVEINVHVTIKTTTIVDA